MDTMEKKNPLQELMQATMEKVHEMVDANNIVGESAPEAVLTKTVSAEAPVPPIGPGLPGYVAPKIEATPTAPAEITNIQFD